MEMRAGNYKPHRLFVHEEKGKRKEKKTKRKKETQWKKEKTKDKLSQREEKNKCGISLSTFQA
jgi:hypothetical protein